MEITPGSLPARWSICLPVRDGRLDDWVEVGSALIARVDPDGDDGRLIADFEGNLYGAINLRSYRARLGSAAWRSVEHAPTVARMRVQREDLQVIGSLLLERDGSLSIEIEPGAALDLARWLGISAADRAAWCEAPPDSLDWPRGQPLTVARDLPNSRPWVG